MSEPPSGVHDLTGRVKVLWEARYDGPASNLDSSQAMAVSPDGTAIFVTGRSRGDYATVAYDAATGRETWNARYDGPGWADAASAIAERQGTGSGAKRRCLSPSRLATELADR